MLVQMGTLKYSKSHALATNQGNKDKKDNGKQFKKKINQGENNIDGSSSNSKVDNKHSSNQGKHKRENLNMLIVRKLVMMNINV